REAINISIQICSALSKAHNRHIVHRDIKPHNIIMNSDGVPKVSDFGIARWASNDTATMKIETIGSVHYSSPEQVRGGYTDEKSDIYSIGVTIFEMLTGKLPFDGETPVAVALKQIQDEPPMPSSLKPGIPAALDQIVLKCMAKSKKDRYESVTELINDLENVRTKPNESLDIIIPNVKHEGDKFVTKKIENLGVEDLKTNQPDKKNIKKKHAQRKIWMPILYVTLILIILGGMGVFIKTVLNGITQGPVNSPKQVTLGNYVGRDIDEVKQELTQNGIDPVNITYEFSENVDENVVISQNPPADTQMVVGGLTTLKLVVSKGEDMVEIPPVKFEDHNALRLKMQDDLGLIVEEKSEYNEEVGSNLVIRSEPEAGTKVKKGSTVTLYWSLGPEKKPVVVPDLKNLTYEQAVSRLMELNLKLGKTLPEGREGYQGKVIDQFPKAGETVNEDTAVDITFEDQTTPTSGETTPTGGGQATQPSGENKTLVINLPEGYSFGDTVRFRAFVIDNTGTEYQLIDEASVPVTDFPRTIVVPVPANGGITVKVFINDLNVLEQSF
ncbi:MAG: PASTA domain-containing protein, partial [Clostridia bacterium]|nr:PASTA domain-containing protein [Clostridia bacterium]